MTLVEQLAAEHKHFRVVPDARWKAADYCYTCREKWPCLVQRIADENTALRETLEGMEFVGGEFGSFCPWCGGSDPNDPGWRATVFGHRPDCRRQGALKGTEGA